ncbi:hypothetical protein DSO57_1031755 [Entomophthora muscae]|uniref:Uncharacterized protein n=1 Tax=Entomophthora muscae TaxID=34485 RepID=A0ACC2UA69_9FUNG|nr:hypothetical protein DSO57_1031755 [Entomophthora muscae]
MLPYPMQQKDTFVSIPAAIPAGGDIPYRPCPSQKFYTPAQKGNMPKPNFRRTLPRDGNCQYIPYRISRCPSRGLIAKAIYHNTSANVLFQSPGHKQ